MSDTHSNACCQHRPQQPSLHQSLDEMEYERGLWSAARDGETEKVAQLLRDGRDPNQLDSGGLAPIHYASRYGHVEICQMLLRHGADVNVRTRAGQCTPLQRASFCGHTPSVTLLLENGARVDAVDADLKNALHKACECSHQDVIKVLLAHADKSGINLTDCRDHKDKKPMEYLEADKQPK